MRRGLIFVVAAALLLTTANVRAQQSPAAPTQPQQGTPPPPQPNAPPQSGQTRIVQFVNLVDVLFTVLDRRNKLVPGLEKEDFKHAHIGNIISVLAVAPDVSMAERVFAKLCELRVHDDPRFKC